MRIWNLPNFPGRASCRMDEWPMGIYPKCRNRCRIWPWPNGPIVFHLASINPLRRPFRCRLRAALPHLPKSSVSMVARGIWMARHCIAGRRRWFLSHIYPKKERRRDFHLPAIYFDTKKDSLVTQAFENFRKCAGDGVEHLMIMVFECHLQVQANEFRQMPMGVWVFGTEHGADRVHFIEIGGNGHLLVQLRRLCQICWVLEVADGEHICTAFTRRRYDFWCVNFGETCMRHTKSGL